MLERLLNLLEKGPIEVQIALHGPTVQVVKKAQIVAADQVGVVARIKGAFGGDYGPDRLFPWAAISAIDPV